MDGHFGLPFAFLALAGTWYLWVELHGWGIYVWAAMTATMAVGYYLGWHWQRKQQLLRPVYFEPPTHWTDRDNEAWKRVEARGQAAATIDSAKFTDLQYYVTVAEEMGKDLAAFYHPKAKDPVGNLTIPEILAVIELASHDMADWSTSICRAATCSPSTTGCWHARPPVGTRPRPTSTGRCRRCFRRSTPAFAMRRRRWGCRSRFRCCRTICSCGFSRRIFTAWEPT